MALSFNGVEPVSFGGKECTPKINTELKMRLSEIKEYDSAADIVLASVFPDDEAYVLKFLQEKMTTLDKQILHAYLIGGDTMVSKLMGSIDDTLKGVNNG